MKSLSLFSQMQHSYYEGGYRVTQNSQHLSPAGAVTFMIVLFLVVALIYVIHAYFLGLIFKKAGVERWKAWVPIYNNWVLLELGNQKGLWAVLAIVPVVNIVSAVFMYIAMYHIGRKLGKDDLFVLLAIFLPTVWIIWLAVDTSTWAETPTAVSSTENMTSKL
jgi:hypothetical protein